MKIKALEGLRGWLALYVLVSHCIIYSAYFKPEWYPLQHGHLAVDCFIILSGFVIALLIDTKKEPYLPYITRRFFRLYPAYIVFVVIGLTLVGVAKENAICLFLYSDELALVLWTRTEAWGDNLIINCLSKVFMLHGVIPDIVVQSGAEAFLGSAWSISLEWQFYLVAPILLWLFRSRVGGVSAVVVFCLLMQYRHLIPMASQGASLPAHIEFFALGIISYFVYKNYAPRVTNIVQFFVLGLLGLLIFIGKYKALALAPVVLWIVVFTFFLCRPTRSVDWILTNPVSLYLGKISFSLYLCHELVITMVQYYLYQMHTYIGQERHFMWLLILTIPTSILVATLGWYLLERPGMRLGIRIANRMTGNPVEKLSN